MNKIKIRKRGETYWASAMDHNCEPYIIAAKDKQALYEIVTHVIQRPADQDKFRRIVVGHNEKRKG